MVLIFYRVTTILSEVNSTTAHTIGTDLQDVHDFISLLQTGYGVLEELVEFSLKPVGINTPGLQFITGTTSTSIRVKLRGARGERRGGRRGGGEREKEREGGRERGEERGI